MLHGYQIDNVVFLIEGLKSGRNTAELMNAVDPLVYFKELKYPRGSTAFISSDPLDTSRN